MSLGEVLASAIFGIRQPTRRDLRPAPRQKLPEISPIFKADTVRLHVSREKDGKLHLVDAGWDDAKVVQPDGCGQVRRGWKGWILPPGRGER